MNTVTIKGYYGADNTPCNILAYTSESGGTWYCVEGSVNVNLTYDDIALGCDTETLSDCDSFTWSSTIEDEQGLSNAVEF